MLRIKKLALAAATAGGVLALTLSPAAAATQAGCVAYNYNNCVTWQVCEADSSGHGSCTYYYPIRGQWVGVYSEAF